MYDHLHQKAYYLDKACQIVSTAGFVVDYTNEFEIDFFWSGWVIKAKNRF